MPSLSPSHQSLIDDLIKDIGQHNPADLIQHCANYFNRLLESERTTHLSRPATASTTMTDTAGGFANPFGSGSNAKTIQEEDEERDTFGSPTNASFPTRGAASPFSPNPFAASTGGPASSSLFGNWSTGSAEQDHSSSSLPNNYAPGRRTSVSAESMQPNDASESDPPPSFPKTPEQLSRLRAAVVNNFLFSQLDEDSFALVMGALQEKQIPAANIKVISQGDAGDYFYVIESGEFEVYINGAGSLQPGPEGMGGKVATIGPGGSFGELALMYNAPRAATVVSASKGCTLWALDRVTFRRILMDNASQRRKMYESFLEDVPLLAGLKTYDRAKIADALESVKVPAGQNIITEGEPGDYFYLLEAGDAEAYKHGNARPIKEYKRGDFFGELALLNDKPRAASVVAKGDVKVARLGRDGFKRLLGPVESLMRKEDYAQEELDPLTKESTVT